METKAIKPNEELTAQAKRNLKKTMLAMLGVILGMALLFNFQVPLVFHKGDSSEANVILWPIRQTMEYLVFDGFKMEPGQQWTKVVLFLLTELPYVFLLIVIFSYAFNFARSFSTDQELALWMRESNGFLARVTGAVAGFVSPFCSCSTIPVMTSLARARTPFPTVMAFLITSPMINEAGIALMWSYFGYKVALIYMGFGFLMGILGSYVATWFKFSENAFLPSVLEEADGQVHAAMKMKQSLKRMHRMGVIGMKKMVKQVWWIIILALIVGGIMHGWIPEDWIKNNVGDKWWGPLVLIPMGILIYLNISATLPIVNSFVTNGLNIGTGLGFLMAVNTVSLPEIMMLTKIFKRKFMVFFVTYLLVTILLFAYLMLLVPQSALLV